MANRPNSLPIMSLGQQVKEIFAASECVPFTQDLQADYRRASGLAPTSPSSSSPEFSPSNSDYGSFYEDNIVLVSEEEGGEATGQEDLPSEDFAVLSLMDKGKRGRRPIRPFDPIKKKTEEKDKYWLRAFRGYMKTNYPKLKKNMTADERFFWRDHLSPEGKPEKGNRFLSYGKLYKKSLFSNTCFVRLFQQWFLEHAEEELLKKCVRDSDLWFVFYDYGSKELFSYNPSAPSPPPDSGSVSPRNRMTPEPQELPPVADYDITMVETDSGVENLLDNI